MRRKLSSMAVSLWASDQKLTQYGGALIQVLCTIKRNPTPLATYQDKTFKIDNNMGMAISGLTSDARKTHLTKALSTST
jgi:hypothetical protein